VKNTITLTIEQLAEEINQALHKQAQDIVEMIKSKYREFDNDLIVQKYKEDTLTNKESFDLGFDKALEVVEQSIKDKYLN